MNLDCIYSANAVLVYYEIVFYEFERKALLTVIISQVWLHSELCIYSKWGDGKVLLSYFSEVFTDIEKQHKTWYLWFHPEKIRNKYNSFKHH